MVKSPTWQLARVYIYTLPFANLDMNLGNCQFAGGGILICDYNIIIFTTNSFIKWMTFNI
jgi:hypothetical protein